MKKLLLTVILAVLLLSSASVFASNNADNNNVVNNINSTNNDSKRNETEELTGSASAGQLVELKENAKRSLEHYQEIYNSKTYGFAAYILDIVRLYSIPFCFVGIAISAIYQNVIGAHRLDVRDTGHHMLIGFITFFVIAQSLPLIFAIVIKGFGAEAY